MIFDTHAHFDDSAFNSDRDELLQSLPASGIGRVVNVASGMPSCLSSMSLADRYSYVYAAVGVHPAETEGVGEEQMRLLEEYCRHEKVVAVGEIGLDYHYPDTDKKEQENIFRLQLQIAKKVGKPVIIHSRDAAADTMNIMKSENAQEIGGVIHCFSYSAEMARQYVDMGFFIGIGGVITFKNSKKLRECVETLPLSALVLETDCPYLAPEPVRGHRNSSLNLPRVIEKIALIKGISEEEVMEATWDNAMSLYRMKG